MSTTYFQLVQGQRTQPTEDEKRELFCAWYASKENYRQARQKGGGKILGLAEAYELFCRRWKPVGQTDTSLLPKPWGQADTSVSVVPIATVISDMRLAA